MDAKSAVEFSCKTIIFPVTTAKEMTLVLLQVNSPLTYFSSVTVTVDLNELSTTVEFLHIIAAACN